MVFMVKGAYAVDENLKNYYGGGENDVKNQADTVVGKIMHEYDRGEERGISYAAERPERIVEARPTGKAKVTRPQAAAAEGIADYYGLADVNVLYAISTHETQHGKAGAGRQGYYMGVGVPTRGAKKPQYASWIQQCNWVAMRLARCQRENNNELDCDTLLMYANTFHRPDDREAWAKGVWKVYRGR